MLACEREPSKWRNGLVTALTRSANGAIALIANRIERLYHSYDFISEFPGRNTRLESFRFRQKHILRCADSLRILAV